MRGFLGRNDKIAENIGGTDHMRVLANFGILVIRSDDSRAHIYDDMSRLMQSSSTIGQDPGAVEFFNTTGRRLAPIFDPGWRLLNLVETAEAPQPNLIVPRLRSMVRQMRTRLLSDAEAVQAAGLKVETGLAMLPSLDGMPLDAALLALNPILDHLQNPAPGTHTTHPWHNFWVHGIL